MKKSRLNKKRLEEAVGYGIALASLSLVGVTIVAHATIIALVMETTVAGYLQDWTFWIAFPLCWFVFGFLFKTIYFAYWDKRKGK